MTDYLSAQALECTEAERDALITVHGRLNRGELVHAKSTELGDNLFNMAQFGNCGTPCCIGGWMWQITKVDTDPNGPFFKLFYPSGGPRSLSSITPKQAANACLNFLTTGDPKWNDAIEGDMP